MPTSAGMICYWKLRGFIPERSFQFSVFGKSENMCAVDLSEN